MGTATLADSLHIAARRAMRERRRVALVMVLAFLGGMLLYSHVDATIFGVPFPLFAGTFYAVGVGISSILLSVLCPRFRHAVEMIAVSRFAVAVIAFLSPAVSAALIASPFLSASCVVGGAFMLNKIVTSPQAASWLMVPARSLAVTIRTAADPRRVARLLDEGKAEAEIRAELGRLPGAAALRGLPIRLENLVVRDLGPVREITLQIARPGLPLALYLRALIDDTLGRAVDRMLAQPLPVAVPAAPVTAEPPVQGFRRAA